MFEFQFRQLTSFVFVLAMFICIFGVGAHAIFCPNDAVDSRMFTRLFTQPWLFLFGYSGFAEFVGTIRYYCGESLLSLSSAIMFGELVQRDNRSAFLHILLSHLGIANYNIVCTSFYNSPFSHFLCNTLFHKRSACSI